MPEQDLEIVNEFLRKSATLKDRERAELAGVSLRQISRWKKGEVRPLQDSTRNKLERYNMTHASDADRSVATMMISELRAKLDEFEARLGVAEPIPVESFKKLD